MELYRTTFPIPVSSSLLSHTMPAVFMGSCFTEHIGQKLTELKFPVDVNPFGVIYNPWSVKNCLEVLIREKEFTKKELHYFDHQWLSFYHQTSFSHPDLQHCLKTINDGVRYSSGFLKTAEFLFITFGSARVFTWKESGQVVSNCHKIPADQFERRMLSPGEITRMFVDLMNELSKFNPRLKVVFTVSPVRHWKDGAVGNQVSKATLLLAIHNLRENFSETGYFPAYEIVMDDLRDYRFYAEDMIHLNRTANDYIWRLFKHSFIEKESQETISEIEKILEAVAHRPMKPDSESHRKFLQESLKYAREVQKKYPFLDLSREMGYFAGKE
jgi:hypothetical protein